MMALVKTLIVCIWVELELVIGESTHCLISEPLPRKLVYSQRMGNFLSFQVYPWPLQEFPQEYYFEMVVIIDQAGPATKCLNSLSTLSSEEFHEQGQASCLLDYKEVMLVIVHREEELGGVLFFLPSFSYPQSLQKEGYKYQTILPHLVARAILVGKRKSHAKICCLPVRRSQSIGSRYRLLITLFLKNRKTC